MTLRSLLRHVARALWKSPVALVLLQIPSGILEVIGRGLALKYEESLLLAAVLFFPYSVAGALSTALTHAYITHGATSQRSAWSLVTSRLGRLIPTACLASLLCLCGMVALLFPALYFMTVFLVFPQLVVEDGHLPWSVYLVRSKKLVRPAFWTTLALVVLGFAIELGVERLGSLAGSSLGEMFTLMPARYAVLLTVQVFLFMVMSATINTWAAYYFMRLKASADETNLRTA